MWVRISPYNLINLDSASAINAGYIQDNEIAIVAYDLEKGEVTLSTYHNEDGATKAMLLLEQALSNGDRLFIMPTESSLLTANKSNNEHKTKTVKTTPKGNVGKVIELWNSLESKGLKPVTRISQSSDRHKMLMSRIREFGMDNIEKAIENIRRSDYLCKQKWFNFDWFIRPNNFPKVLDGNYNDDNGDKLDSFWDD